ncbi:uncharacterized protein N0V89_001651 [Didymosphaeria variabile]|uniref:Uncharacterized protein n=1 Tax=Didymosphaeria variabile TaxID=1932322 RepID=A0A9W9CGX6_9PLEO|nr:uncharacterized protein N0V89_001651 [Didymosphaeria variabile]KAJ4361082.1 hypothetical protein N0V89_001651 [Didymosphaeria variabile]
MVIIVHSAASRPTGGPAFSRAQKKDIAEQMDDALDESSHTHSRSAELSEDEQTSAKVSMWMTDTERQEHFVDRSDDQQPDNSTTDGPSAEEQFLAKMDANMGVEPEDWDTSADDPAAVPDMDDSSDIEDTGTGDWVLVGEGDEVNKFVVPVPSTYEYKKADAAPARKGWFGWFY